MVITELSAYEIERAEGLLWQLPPDSVALIAEDRAGGLALWLATEQEIVSNVSVTTGRLEVPTNPYTSEGDPIRAVQIWKDYWTLNNPRSSRLYIVASFSRLSGDGLW